MDEEWEYSISDTAELPERQLTCLGCGVNLQQSDMSRHTIECDKRKRAYEKRLKAKAEAAVLRRTLEKLL